MCNFYVPFHLSLNAGHLLLALKKEDFSSPKLWSTVAASGNDGPPLLCTLYSLITTRLVSNGNFLNARHQVLIEDAHCWNEWRRNSSAEHLAMSCSLCTKGKYSRSCWKAPLMHQSWVNLDSGNTTKEQTADSLFELEKEKSKIISILPPSRLPGK